MPKAKTEDDLERLPSNALDDLVESCKRIRSTCGKPLEVTVERRDKDVADSEGDGTPLYYEVKLLYIARDVDEPKHPVLHEETVARLLFDQDYIGDRPILKTTSEGLRPELNLQIAARLARLHSLVGKGAVKSVIYYPNPKTSIEVTEEVIRQMTAGKEMPKEVYCIIDNLNP